MSTSTYASQQISLILNAGGGSRRMGTPKPLLPTPPDGQPLLRHVLGRMHARPWLRTVVVANEPGWRVQLKLPDDVIYVADAFPGMGALGGIATGLQLCDGWALVLAADMPLVSPDLCEWLCRQALALGQDPPPDVVMPMVGGKAQPFHALYHSRTLPAIRAQLARGERMAIGFLSKVNARFVDEEEMRVVDPDLHSFVNVNTPEEWAAALELLRAE
jgi:molybdopterin-guanine dinucleotide biosynthesis protein A